MCDCRPITQSENLSNSGLVSALHGGNGGALSRQSSSWLHTGLSMSAGFMLADFDPHFETKPVQPEPDPDPGGGNEEGSSSGPVPPPLPLNPGQYLQPPVPSASLFRHASLDLSGLFSSVSARSAGSNPKPALKSSKSQMLPSPKPTLRSSQGCV